MTDVLENAAKFVHAMIKRCQSDTACRAALTRADNPGTEAHAWPYLVAYCDLASVGERKAFGVVGAAIARAKPQANGTQPLGEALRQCKAEAEDKSVERKLRRVLACDGAEELAAILRSLLRFIQNHEKARLNYVALLRDILCFGETVRLRWASQYYGTRETPPEAAAGKEEDQACS